MSGTLVLVRHGQSEWNKLNLFTGWKDPDLTELGVEEARDGAQQARLAAARRAEHGRDAGLDAQVEPAQHPRAAEADAQAGHLERGHASSPPPTLKRLSR